MKKGLYKIYALQLFIIIFFVSILITSKVLTNKMLIALILVLYAFITRKIISRTHQSSIYKKDITKYMTIFAILYVVLYYVIGIYVGYYVSAYKFGIHTIINYIIPSILIIITSEIIRNEFLSEKTNASRINTLIFTVLVDLVMYVNIYNIFNLNEFLEAIGYIFFASIVSNILFNYISEEFGIVPNIIYRIITTIYLYIIPFTPDVYIYFKSVCRMLYPLLIYIVLKSVYEKDKKVITVHNRKLKAASTIISIVIMAIVAMLISCKFTYGMLVIGSGSMTGTLDKGDAIIYKNSKDIKDIKKGDIILYSTNTKIIVHRVVKIEDINDEIRLYTKGDNNIQQDSGYVTRKTFKGKVKLKIAKIGQPTIWINEFFERVKRG